VPPLKEPTTIAAAAREATSSHTSGPPPGRAAPAPSPDERRYRALALTVVLMGVMITAVDTTIVVLGLPVMMRRLHSDMLGMVWVIMAYLLVLTVTTTQLGRFGDMFGRVRMYNLGFLVFTVGSVLCGLAGSGAELVAFRIVQGLGGAMVSANSGAIIADTVPPAERGRAYGLTAIGWNIGAVLGILLGGLIITFVNWRYIFFINLPIGAAGLLIGWRVLRERSPRASRRLDLVGAGLLGAGLLLVLLALTGATGAGWTSTATVKLVVGAVLLAALVLWERRAPAPLVDMALLRHRVLSASVLAALFQSMGGYAVIFLVIMYLQGVRGLSPFAASLLLTPGYVVGGLLGPVAGRLADRVGARLPASVGLALQGLSFGLYATLTPHSHLAWVVVAALVNGIGSAAFFPANNSAVMASAPRGAYGVASGLLRTMSNVGMVTSFAVALLAASASIPRQAAFAIFLGVTTLTAPLARAFVQGLRSSLFLAIALVAVAVVLSILRGREDRSQA
jgi:EmrB/QacA subfamily drug resistance transporter